MESLNLGIVAHVDAGKTSLTERLLYDAGAIEHLGSVERGDTQTDTLAIERRRGITVRSAVVSFAIGDLSVNLIDTPGHPDFIAEVERVLRILDGAVLVLSAVEGVQPQTRVLMRTLSRLEIPTLLFVNKIDRTGAQEGPLLGEIARRLELTVVPMGSTSALGTTEAEFEPWAADDPAWRAMLVETLVAHDEQILADYVEDEGRLDLERLEERLRAQTGRCLVHPVFFGSARTGAGVAALASGIADLLPRSVPGDPEAPALGTVFKIERGSAREKIAHVRMVSGTLRIRDRLAYGQGHEDTVTAVAPAGRAAGSPQTSVSAGSIGKIWGLRRVQIGDRVGQAGAEDASHQFAPPIMEAGIRSRNPADQGRLLAALGELAEQDPLIGVRRDDRSAETAVSLYGEVQKEVIESTLGEEYGIEVAFSDTTTIYIERPIGMGEAVHLLTSDANPYMATVGLRIEPALVDSGVTFVLDVDQRSVPLYIYKTRDRFVDHMTHYIERGLHRGRFGWEVTDCVVTLTDCDYYIGDGPTKPTVSMARTSSADFRGLTPRVVAESLARAGTSVCEPMLRLNIEAPSPTMGELLGAVAQLGGVIDATQVRGEFSTIEATMSAPRADQLLRQLPELSKGEGDLESSFAGYQPVQGKPPKRPTELRG